MKVVTSLDLPAINNSGDSGIYSARLSRKSSSEDKEYAIRL